MENQNDFHEFEKLFWKLSREMAHIWEKIYKDTFPGSQSHILFLLQRNGPNKMSELAVALHLTPGAITTASDRLNEQGYISRLRDKEDRRVVHLELTEKGSSKLKELQSEGQKIMKLVFKDVSDADIAMMNTIFKDATINIDNIGGN